MKVFIIMSHQLKEEQLTELEQKFYVEKTEYLPKNLLELWGNIDPLGELPKEEIQTIVNWIRENSEEGDYVAIQGEFGATFYLVDFCLKNGLVPLYATTKREIEEFYVGNELKTQRVFKHVNFRKYQDWREEE